MKKLKLSESNFAGAEVLSRAQLKKVIGGLGSTDCDNDGDCPIDSFCTVGECVTKESKCGPDEFDLPTTWYCCGSEPGTGTAYEDSKCGDIVSSCAGMLVNDISRCI